MGHRLLGEILESSGIIGGEQLESALKLQKSDSRRLGAVLLEEGMITPKQLALAFAEQLGIEFIDLSAAAISPALSGVLPRSTAVRNRLVPVSADENSITVAMADPTDFFAIEEVRAATRRRVTVMAAVPAEVENAAKLLYGNEAAAKAIEEMRSEGGPAALKRQGAEKPRPDESSQSPTVRLVDSIIERGVAENASDIHIEPTEGDMAVRMRIDGLLRRIMTVPGSFAASVIARIKVMSELDLTEKRLPQDGRAKMRVGGADIDLRISTLPTIWGEKAAIRILNRSARILSPEALGLSGSGLEGYNRILKFTDGLVLAVGPTGSGKSSTMYTMIDRLNTEEANLVTLEDPVEYDIPGVNQVQISERAGLSFAAGLRAVLRQDPDIIAVGEIRDGETAQIALRAALTGHLVLSTVHTSGVSALLDRLADMGCEPFMTAEALRGVISQRLVRKICPDCREEYGAEKWELEKLGISGPARLCRGAGCPSCHHTGFRGRTGVFEVFIPSREVKRMIAEKRPPSETEAQIFSEGGFTPLAEEARRLVLSGVTTIGEMMRIMNSTD